MSSTEDKIDRVLLSDMYRFALEEMRNTSPKPRQTSEAHLAMCWLKAMVRISNLHDVQVIIKGEPVNDI